MSAADELRAAADRLEALAKDATPGPWCTVHGGCVWSGDRNSPHDDSAPIVTDSASPDDHAYIAAMHPGVGLALAAWLRGMTDHAAWGSGCNFCGVRALAVARAINGGAS